VALIITLIMLAVVTFMALTFLAISRRERGAVTTTTDQNTANNAAAAALASAEAQIMANTLATTNPYIFGLLVSTNYINTNGFVSGVANPTNVNYYDVKGNFLTGGDFLQNLANLEYLPRPPVFIPSPPDDYANPTNYDFRFFLNLNHNVDTNGNARFDPNGVMLETNNAGLSTGLIVTNIGDPEWIGVLQHPDQPYGPNNPFVARYAFVAVPIGNALDLNAIHNQALTRTLTNSSDGFFRNEGVGSWEINLAAFLADLNTNQWDPPTIENTANNPYNYREWQTPNFPNTGAGFEDALSLLSYRYGGAYNNLASVDTLYDVPPKLAGDIAFRNDNIDGYSDGPLQTGFQLPGDIASPPNDNPLLPWAGADNTNHFFNLQELFNPTEVTPAFTNHLVSAGNGVSTYDRYTYYRLLSQMGVESAPEQNQINLNYSNAAVYFTNGVITNIAIFPGAQTNFVSWRASNFFLIAADKMLRTYSQEWLVENPSNYVATYGMTTNIGTLAFPTNVPVPFGVSDIPVLINGQFVYTPAVQRVLQLAANIYDATTNNAPVLGKNFPSVFRPTFLVTIDPVSGYRNVYINGYQQVLSVPYGTSDSQLALPVDVTSLFPGSYYGLNCSNVYGVPWIIGAKKGFPNFNEFSLESIVGITRRLQFTRPTTNAPAPTSVDFSGFRTNQMYTMCVSNWLGVEYWNSYTNNYYPSSPNGLTILVRDNLSMTLTNDGGMLPVTTGNLLFYNSTNITPSTTPNYWPGVLMSGGLWSGNGYPTNASFIVPLYTNFFMQLNPNYPSTTNYWWAYRFEDAPPDFVPVPANLFEKNISGFPFPHFGLLTTNHLQVFMLDGTNVIDYVQFAGPDSARNLNTEIFTDDGNGVWNTNGNTNLSIVSSSFGVPIGVLNQIQISGSSIKFPAGPPPEDGTWNSDPEAIPLGGTREQQQAYFDGFFRAGNIGSVGGATFTNLDLTNEAPYEPTRYVVLYTTWQANDPLVHYTVSDLNVANTSGKPQPGTNQYNYGNSILILPNIGNLNDHYTPWGRAMPAFLVPDTYDLEIKDPLVWESQDWDFPTNKFPTVGWLGRVHRGTPWQTVYLKSPDVVSGTNNQYGPVGTNAWVTWTGDGNPYDAVNSAPVQDRLLFDLFTTAFNDNATRGQLSVNVGASDPNNPQAGLAAWSALFSGVIALSNNATISTFDPPSENGVQHGNSLTNFIALSPINPAGPAGTNSALGQIVASINSTRATFTNVDELVGSFEHVGDILAVPQLSDQSPFLNTNNVQRQNGINNEMYDWLPQQVMSLLRVSGTPQSPMRYVIYSYGQALKPAPNGIYTGGGPFFGMVTNYQVVAEAATRAVVNFNSARTNIVTTVITNNGFGNVTANWVVQPVMTNNNAVIQRYNVLPPD
jgi:hypothetical protein